MYSQTTAFVSQIRDGNTSEKWTNEGGYTSISYDGETCDPSSIRGQSTIPLGACVFGGPNVFLKLLAAPPVVGGRPAVTGANLLDEDGLVVSPILGTINVQSCSFPSGFNIQALGQQGTNSMGIAITDGNSTV